MKKTLFALCSALAIAGCAIKPEKFVGPNNKDAYTMDCGGDLATCYRKATELCPAGYTIINSTSGSQLVTNTYTKQSISIPQATLAIECK